MGIFEQVLQLVAVPVGVAVGVGGVDVGALEGGGAADKGAVRVALDGAAGEVFVAHEAEDAEGLDVLQVVGEVHAVRLDCEKAAVAGLDVGGHLSGGDLGVDDGGEALLVVGLTDVPDDVDELADGGVLSGVGAVVSDIDSALDDCPLRRVEQHTRDPTLFVADEPAALGVLDVVVDASLLEGDGVD